MDFDEIKNLFSIFHIARMYGADPVRETGEGIGTKNNPTRVERTSSIKLYASTNSWTDYGTGTGGDIIHFVMAAENISKGEAVKKIKEMAGVEDIKSKPHEYVPLVKNSYMAQDIIMRIWNDQKEINFENGEKELLYIAPRYVFDEASNEDISSFHDIVRLENQTKSLFVLLRDELGIARTLRYRSYKIKADIDREERIVKWYAMPGSRSSFLYTHTKDPKELYLIVEGTHDYLSAILCGYNVMAVPSANFKISDEILKDKLCVFIDDDDGKDSMRASFDNAKCAKIWFDHKEFKKKNKIKKAKDFSDYLEHFKTLESFKSAIAEQCDILAHSENIVPTNRLLRFSDLTNNITAPEWMVKNILPMDGLMEIVGASGSYKSFIVLDLMYCISSGIEYHKRDVKQGTCIYVAGEGKTGAILRMRGLERRYGVPADNFWILPMPSNMMCPIEMDALASDIRCIAPDGVSVVMFDTLHRNSAGSKENSSDDFATILGNVDKFLKPYSKIVGYVHHTGKGETNSKTGRGTSSRFGAMDTSLFINMIENKLASFECMKQKDGEAFEPIYFNMTTIDLDMLNEYGEPTFSLYPELHEGELPNKKDNDEEDDGIDTAQYIYDYLSDFSDYKNQTDIIKYTKGTISSAKTKSTLWDDDNKGVLWEFKKGDRNAWLFKAIPKQNTVQEFEYKMSDEEMMELFNV